MAVTGEPGRQVGSVGRALALLDALAEGPAGVNALARRIGVNPSSASRLLATLERGGLVARDPGGPYRLQNAHCPRMPLLVNMPASCAFRPLPKVGIATTQ